MLNAVPGHDDYNCYLNLAEAEEFLNERVVSKWTKLSEEEKEQYLIMSSQLLNKYKYKGEQFFPNCTLAFPRSGILLPPYKDISQQSLITPISMVNFNFSILQYISNPFNVYYAQNLSLLEKHRTEICRFFYDPFEVPKAVKRATAELANYMVENGTDFSEPMDNVKRSKLDTMEIEYFETPLNMDRDLFPMQVRWLIQYFRQDWNRLSAKVIGR